MFLTARRIATAAACYLAAVAPAALAQSALPDPAITPGAINPAVTQATIGATICRRGWARTVRPPEEYTYTVKRRLLADAGHPGPARAYELDHLIPLELGGAPADARNLWLEPRRAPDGWTAAQKDRLEKVLHGMVCDGRMTLRAAQWAVANDWPKAFLTYARDGEE